MRVLITGDRNWEDADTIVRRLRELRDEHGLDLLVIHGGATGADITAGMACDAMGVDQVCIPANWRGRGKAAGPFRNVFMFKLTKPDLVVAFHDNIHFSKGTKHMVEYAESKGCPVEIVASTRKFRPVGV